MLADLKRAGKLVIGVKQVTKAVNKGLVSEVILANDVAGDMLKDLQGLCQINGIKLSQEMTRTELGKECGIHCEASAAGIIR